MKRTKESMLSSDFLENKESSIEFPSSVKLFEYFRIKDFSREARIKNALYDDKGERVSLKIYLTTLSVQKKLNFPLKIIKFESPDFIIIEVEDKIETGIEITQNIPTEMGKDQSIMDKNPGQYYIEFDPNGHDLKKTNAPMDCMPTMGNQDIDKYVLLNHNAILRKLNKLNNHNFRKCSSNTLVILDEYGEPISDKKHKTLLKSLSCDLIKLKESLDSKVCFDIVSFIKGGNLYHDLIRSPAIYEYKNIL
jgi:hypothetical protein